MSGAPRRALCWTVVGVGVERSAGASGFGLLERLESRDKLVNENGFLVVFLGGKGGTRGARD